MSSKDITVVITSFKSDKIIRNCLNSIDRQYKVIIIENSNNLDFKKSIEKEFTNVECFLSGENLGYGKANNIGLGKVRTKYSLILNPDAMLDDDAIENFFLAIEQISEFAIIGPLFQTEKNNIASIEKKDAKPIEVKNVKGFAMFLNMSEFKDVGFFDENFFFYFEEIDLCKRLTDKNKKIYLVPSIKIHHTGGKSHDDFFNKEMELSRNWHWMWSTFYYHKKYKGFFISLLTISGKLSSAIIKMIIYTLFSNKYKKEIYYCRYQGLMNAIKGKKSWYRPKV